MLEAILWPVVEFIGYAVVGPSLEATGSWVIAAASFGRVHCDGVWAYLIGAALWITVMLVVFWALALR